MHVFLRNEIKLRSSPDLAQWQHRLARLFGYVLQATGSYRWPWLGLAAAMVGALGTLTLVRERRRPL